MAGLDFKEIEMAELRFPSLASLLRIPKVSTRMIKKGDKGKSSLSMLNTLSKLEGFHLSRSTQGAIEMH